MSRETKIVLDARERQAEDLSGHTSATMRARIIDRWRERISLLSAFPYLGEGQGRWVVAINSLYVLKIPKSRSGEWANVEEARRYTKDPHLPLAPCGLLSSSYLIMERVSPIEDWNADTSIFYSLVADNVQVGSLPCGRAVLYDYAY